LLISRSSRVLRRSSSAMRRVPGGILASSSSRRIRSSYYSFCDLNLLILEESENDKKSKVILFGYLPIILVQLRTSCVLIAPLDIWFLRLRVMDHLVHVICYIILLTSVIRRGYACITLGTRVLLLLLILVFLLWKQLITRIMMMTALRHWLYLASPLLLPAITLLLSEVLDLSQWGRLVADHFNWRLLIIIIIFAGTIDQSENSLFLVAILLLILMLLRSSFPLWLMHLLLCPVIIWDIFSHSREITSLFIISASFLLGVLN
jgi:hypothetical protein